MDKVFQGDAIDVLPELRPDSAQMCVTSPPYFNLRDYGVEGQIGTEDSVEEYVGNLVEVFRGAKEVLRDNGTLWLNLGDTYGKNKQLLGIPWRVAFALQADGWILRQDIIWAKKSCMPEPVTDRCTKSHEYIFLFSKQPNYYYNHEAIMTPAKQDWGTRDRTNGKYHNEGTGLSPHTGLTGDKIFPGGHQDTPIDAAAFGMNERRGSTSNGFANKRSVWNIATAGYRDAHFATFPEELVETCIKAGSAVGDLVLDPFSGAATTGVVAIKNLRSYVGIELNPEYVEMSQKRLDAADSQNRIFA
jgi:site-specific DNA-methyltransferase (adenine-specific)